MKLHNCGPLGLGTSRTVSAILNSLLQRCDVSFFSTYLVVHVFCYKTTCKGTYIIIYVKRENYVWKKCFYYFQGLRTLKWHRTKCSNHMNYQPTNDPCRRLFQIQLPLPPGFPEALTPKHVRISRIPSVRGGVDFLWNNPLK